jgi:glycine betaine/choline ABC-type transport system substrate-binding protein
MRTYSIRLRALPVAYDPGVLYRPVEDGSSDMVAGHLTDAALASADLVVLKDNKDAFRSNMACIAVRTAALQVNPDLRPALDELSGRFTNESMRSMNYDVDVKRRALRDVAADFLESAHLA